MPKIRAFKGYCYGTDFHSRMDEVLAPPYDIISESRQDQLYALNEHNIIRLILGKDAQGDNERENKYTRAAGYLNKWIEDKIFTQETEEAIYIYKQNFSMDGSQFTRTGFLCLVKLDDSAYGHENTLQAPRDDRYNLIRSVKANLSPVFSFCSDDDSFLSRLLEKYSSGADPKFETNVFDVEHKLWAVTDVQFKSNLIERMKDKNVYIADGHHRYEVARSYSLHMSKHHPEKGSENSFNYVMMFITPINDGLKIFPTHRLVEGVSGETFSGFLEEVRSLFNIEKITDRAGLKTRLDSERGNDSEYVLGVYGPDKNYYVLLSKKRNEIQNLLPDDLSVYKKNLDVIVLHEILIKNFLSVNDLGRVRFLKAFDEGFDYVNKNNNGLYFLLRPVTVNKVLEVARNNERMPQKSTYFYPKLASGLVIHKF